MAPLPTRATVLVADDEPLTRWALLQTLARARLEVALASSRGEVCDLLESRPFKVVILANELGHDSMNDVLNALVRDGTTRGVVILYDGDNADDFGRAFPGAVLIQKPFGLEAVTAAIDSFIEPTSEAC